MPKQEIDGLSLFDLALSLVGLISSEGPMKISELAETFDVSEKAIRRAVKAITESEDLTNCETHFYANEDDLAEGYVSFSAGRSNLSGPPKLSKRQLSALAIGLDYLASMPQFKGNKDLDRLRGLFAANGQNATEMPRDRIVDQIDLIQQGLREGLAIHCEYQNQLGERSSRLVDPLRLDFLGRHHYLRGYCHSAQEVRSFRLDRILKLELTDTPLSEMAVSSAVPEEVFGDAGQEHAVKIAAKPEAAEIFWNFPATSDPVLVGDELVGYIQVGQLESLPRHIVRYGGLVRVIEPEAARALVKDFAESVLNGTEAP